MQRLISDVVLDYGDKLFVTVGLTGVFILVMSRFIGKKLFSLYYRFMAIIYSIITFLLVISSFYVDIVNENPNLYAKLSICVAMSVPFILILVHSFWRPLHTMQYNPWITCTIITISTIYISVFSLLFTDMKF